MLDGRAWNEARGKMWIVELRGAGRAVNQELPLDAPYEGETGAAQARAAGAGVPEAPWKPALLWAQELLQSLLKATFSWIL